VSISLALPQLRPDQLAIFSHPAKVKVCCFGRRWGKTVLGGVVVLNTLRQNGRAAWIVPNYKNGAALWRYVQNVCAGAAQAGAMSISKAERVITTRAGGFFCIYSGDNIDSIRSEAFNVVVGDEAARIGEIGWQDAVRPTLADANGDEFLISTPRGKNWFYTEFVAGAQGGDVMSWTAPTSANPHPQIRAAFDKVQQRVKDGLYSRRSFEQEWMAQFVDDGAMFQNVTACATAKPEGPIPGHAYVTGVDWARAAGGDFTVFSVFDATARKQVHLERMSGAPYDVQLAKLRALWDVYKGSIIAEYNSMGGPLVEGLQLSGLPVTGFTTTSATKHEIITALELAFDRQEITILDDPVQLMELNAFERRERAGLPSYSAPEGMHDDTVIALALAYSETGAWWFA